MLLLPDCENFFLWTVFTELRKKVLIPNTHTHEQKKCSNPRRQIRVTITQYLHMSIEGHSISD
jgi:hypothetical protein